jgi:hypothetical protein
MLWAWATIIAEDIFFRGLLLDMRSNYVSVLAKIVLVCLRI